MIASRCKKQSLYLLSYLLSTSDAVVEAQSVAQISCSSLSTIVSNNQKETWSETVYQSVADISDSTSYLMVNRKHLYKIVKRQISSKKLR